MTPPDWQWILHPSLMVAMVLIVIIALALPIALAPFIALAEVIAIHPASPSDAGGRLESLPLIWVDSGADLASLPNVRKASHGAVFTLLTWSGLLALGTQPDPWRRIDNSLTAGVRWPQDSRGMGLEMPLSWQNAPIDSWDAIRQICPAAQRPG